jgi:hypothetical protein
MSIVCLEKMEVEENSEITPQIKKMKLTGDKSPKRSLYLGTSHPIMDAKKHFKNMNLAFSEQVRTLL